MDQVPDKFKKREVVDNIVKQALTAWGDTSSELELGNNEHNTSMLALEKTHTRFDSLFAPMAKSNEEKEDELTFLDVQL